MVADLVADGVESKLLLEIIRRMPSKDALVDADTVAQRLHTLTGTGLSRLSSRGSHEKKKLVQSLIASIVEGRCPDVQSLVHYVVKRLLQESRCDANFSRH